MYVPTPEDRVYINEFREKPVGLHSPGLQRLLNLFRAERSIPHWVLVALKPHEAFVIAELPKARSEPIRLERGCLFTSIEEGEWAVFCRRWEFHTGEKLN
jgi:hypothetical protein